MITYFRLPTNIDDFPTRPIKSYKTILETPKIDKNKKANVAVNYRCCCIQ